MARFSPRLRTAQRRWAPCLALSLSCGGTPRADAVEAGPADAPAPTTTGPSSQPDGEGVSTEVSTGFGTEGGPLYDIGAGDDSADPAEDGCQKIDFVFVIDNSGSMGANQESLVRSFEPFIDTITAQVGMHDFRILVTDSDAGEDLQLCGVLCPGAGPISCGDWCEVADTLDVACERTLGAGEVAPYGHGASNRECGVEGGVRYLTSALEPDALRDAFACIAKVGSGGSGAELPFSALVEAITTQTVSGGCNEGFLRDDALLVATVITDDPADGTADDSSSVGSPQQWYDAVIGAKHGDPAAVVMLGVVPPLGTPRFTEFVGLFGDRGRVGDVTAASYDAFFEDAVGLIDTACDEYPGPAG